MTRTAIVNVIPVLLSLASPGVFAQAPTQAVAPAQTAPAAPKMLQDVVATVTNHGKTDVITKGDVIAFLSHYPAPQPEDREEVYREALDSLINTKLLTQFLIRQNIKVPPEKIETQIEALKQQLKAENQDLPTALRQNNISMENLRAEFENRARWAEYLNTKATDAALRKFVADNRDLFSGTQIRASHILLKIDPGASEADKEKVRQKLLAIKKEIDEKKLTFAQAANKYSQDPANDGGAGGDLDYFSLTTGLIEEFTDVAFKLRKGVVSDPVETPFGYHLILVTDRKEGTPIDFEQNRPAILQQFGADLQKQVVTAERKTAKIDIKPIPRDLFPAAEPAPAAVPAPASGAAETKPAAKP